MMQSSGNKHSYDSFNNKFVLDKEAENGKFII